MDAKDLAEMATTEFSPPEGISPAQGGIILAEGLRPRAQGRVAHRRPRSTAPSTSSRRAARPCRSSAPRPATPRRSRSSTGPSADATRSRSAATTRRSHRDGPGRRAAPGDGPTAAGSGIARGPAPRPSSERSACSSGSSAWPAPASARLAARFSPAWIALVVPAALLAGAGWAAVLRGWELRMRTPKGSGQWLRIESFRRFLHESEASHAEDAAQRGVLREYTAWAVAVGEIDRWRHAVIVVDHDPVQHRRPRLRDDGAPAASRRHPTRPTAPSPRAGASAAEASVEAGAAAEVAAGEPPGGGELRGRTRPAA